MTRPTRGIGSGLDALNALVFAVALSLSAFGATVSVGRGLPDVGRTPELSARVHAETLPDGTRVLRDASGTPVVLRQYVRIASATMIADRVLADLAEPQRIIAFSAHGGESSVLAHRYRDRASLPSRASIEQVLALKPDLLVVNNLVDPGFVGRLREHGVAVFDLGHMRGLETLLPSIRALGLLLGAPERGEGYARALERRMNAVAVAQRDRPKPRALYLSIYADRLYGGAARTSYHDVIVHAGLRDAGAEAGLDGWPELTAERVLALAPEVLVTKVGMGAVLCRHAGFSALGPCAGKGRILELEGALLDDPGPGMLDATEALHDAFWGAP
jgi:iron complex transport system substrate-binding protein